MAESVYQVSTSWISAPLPPDKFIGPARADWESAYPEMLGRYYSLLERFGDGGAVGVDSAARGVVEGVSRGGCDGSRVELQEHGCGSNVGQAVTGDAGAVGGEPARRETDVPVFRRGSFGRFRGQSVGGGRAEGDACSASSRDVHVAHAETLPGAACGGALSSGLADDDQGGSEAVVVGKNNARNRSRRAKWKAQRDAARCFQQERAADSGVECGSGSASGGSVHTVDTRTGVEIEAAQTLAARRVAENRMAEAKAKVEAKLAEHRLVALQDKDRTKAVQKLAAARMEEKINKAKKNSEAYFKDCDQSLKSLGSTGSAGEFALKQQIKDARETELLLKYTKAQADLYAIYAAPEVLAKVAALPPPVMQDEFEAFGDCPDYYTEGEREQYYADLNRRNAEKAEYCDTGDAW